MTGEQERVATTPPASRRGDVVDVLHRRRVADPYRWLEDPHSPETVAWVEAQNAHTSALLAGMSQRAWFTATMDAIVHRPRAGIPMQRSGRFYLTRNDGSQEQDVWYVADTVDELECGGRVLFDPNAVDAAGTTSVPWLTVDGDGGRCALAVSEAGSDWLHYRVVDASTGAPLEDDVEVVGKFSVPEWLPDGSYLYAWYPGADGSDATETAALAHMQLRRHRPGSHDDPVVWEDVDRPMMLAHAEVSHDDRLVVLTLAEGTEYRARIHVRRIRREDGGGVSLDDPVPLVDVPDAEYAFVRADGDRLLLRTDKDAPLGRVVAVDLAAVEAGEPAQLVDVVPEGEDPIVGCTAAGDELIVERLVDATPVLTRHRLDGTEIDGLDLPTGAVLGVEGRVGEPMAFVGLSSVTSPGESWMVDLRGGEVRLLDLAPATGGFTPPPTRTRRRRAPSADGTPVPYWLVTAHDDALEEPRPTILWGYGGFKIPLMADHRPGWPAWLAAGGRLVVANLRGGGEFGTQWYEDGRLGRKQHVFDDVVGVAEALVADGVTSPGQLVLHGRSNGGLLVGAAMTQRPDLFAVAVPAVGVLDLLRFHRFTIGAAWMSDYGDPDDPDDFATLLAYSPLHNVRRGTCYPATMVLTGDHDDRVVPLHSHKLTATLQWAQGGTAPVVTRVETSTGHGAGTPSALVAAEWADWLSFAAFHTGLEVPAHP